MFARLPPAEQAEHVMNVEANRQRSRLTKHTHKLRKELAFER
eukprot:SAG22_NODE_9066_length_611_cov_1.787109_1_plen_41_part_10